ncbi:hypothetical protein [Streptomyces sp. LBL]|uniref:hypothetical protein n=1 Tax=Streptomyces sp. LBL TaxID=2940562 RepID=UPI0024759C42|nr:hypothetical protein [Streptomyces sp. LBL]
MPDPVTDELRAGPARGGAEQGERSRRSAATATTCPAEDEDVWGTEEGGTPEPLGR